MQPKEMLTPNLKFVLVNFGKILFSSLFLIILSNCSAFFMFLLTCENRIFTNIENSFDKVRTKLLTARWHLYKQCI